MQKNTRIAFLVKFIVFFCMRNNITFQIVQGVVNEFNGETPAEASHFPCRNKSTIKCICAGNEKF